MGSEERCDVQTSSDVLQRCSIVIVNRCSFVMKGNLMQMA